MRGPGPNAADKPAYGKANERLHGFEHAADEKYRNHLHHGSGEVVQCGSDAVRTGLRAGVAGEVVSAFSAWLMFAHNRHEALDNEHTIRVLCDFAALLAGLRLQPRAAVPWF